MSDVTEKRVILLASQAHDEWRAPRKLATGGFEPRWKTAKDPTWIAAHGTDQVDIANTAYPDLPAEWQKENREGAKVAINLVESQQQAGLPLDEGFVEQASAIVHHEWTLRNPWADAALLVSYEELPEVEKEKDRIFVRAAIQICQ
jgi:hypothetical protein